MLLIACIGLPIPVHNIYIYLLLLLYSDFARGVGVSQRASGGYAQSVFLDIEHTILHVHTVYMLQLLQVC